MFNQVYRNWNPPCQTPGAADLFVMAKDIAASASVPESQLVVINNIIDINELEAQLRAWFERQ